MSTMEPLTISLMNTQNFDGSTPLELTRDDFRITGNGRVFQKSLSAPAGVIAGDFFGLFSGGSAKLVGVAYSTSNPRCTARVVRKEPVEHVRCEIRLTPRLQYLVMLPGDSLAVRTLEDKWVSLTIVVNDLGEQDHLNLAAARSLEAESRRLRIIRRTSCESNATEEPWRPNFAWDDTASMFVVSDEGTGPLPVSDLCFVPRAFGCYASVRFSNMDGGDGRLLLVEPITRSARVLQAGLSNVEWSKAQFVSHDDMVALDCPPPPADQLLVVDVEISRLLPGERLAARFGQGL